MKGILLIRPLARKPVVTIYVRHAGSCPNDGKEFYRGCQCPKYYRYSLNGKQHRQAAGTRSWATAEDGARNLQQSLDGHQSPEISQPTQQYTIAAALETLLAAKESENISASVQRKLRYQLGLFQSFMESRSKFFPSEITSKDVIEFRATWRWSDLTRIKAQQNLRGFIRAACRENRAELLDALKTIRETKEGRERRKPKPFSEDEIKRILGKTTDPKLKTLVRLMISTGLAIRDAVQLERKNISDGWLRIERQKTSRPVRQKLDPGLHSELMAVLNGNPRYVFWNGTSMADSETKRLHTIMREIMQAAGCYKKGNVFHRFRDTAVDYWLGSGWSMTDVAAALGDTLAVCERHYSDLASKRMEERLAKLPARTW
jgi:integrase